MLRIADKTFDSHLFTGTGKFASSSLMVEAIRASGSQLVTLAMKRVDLRQHNDAILAPLIDAGVTLLPNTSEPKPPKKPSSPPNWRVRRWDKLAEARNSPRSPAGCCQTQLKR